MLTHEERWALIRRPLSIHTHCTDYRWGGVQVVDKFMREGQEDILDALSGEYQGKYSTPIDGMEEME